MTVAVLAQQKGIMCECVSLSLVVEESDATVITASDEGWGSGQWESRRDHGWWSGDLYTGEQELKCIYMFWKPTYQHSD